MHKVKVDLTHVSCYSLSRSFPVNKTYPYVPWFYLELVVTGNRLLLLLLLRLLLLLERIIQDKMCTRNGNSTKYLWFLCTFRYLKEGNSGMSVIEIGFPSGFSADKTSLEQHPLLKRVEDGNKEVILYLDEVRNRLFLFQYWKGFTEKFCRVSIRNPPCRNVKRGVGERGALHN